jgi:hypothetical protein
VVLGNLGLIYNPITLTEGHTFIVLVIIIVVHGSRALTQISPSRGDIEKG